MPGLVFTGVTRVTAFPEVLNSTKYCNSSWAWKLNSTAPLRISVSFLPSVCIWLESKHIAEIAAALRGVVLTAGVRQFFNNSTGVCQAQLRKHLPKQTVTGYC